MVWVMLALSLVVIVLSVMWKKPADGVGRL
jgi:hypothetical protein